MIDDQKGTYVQHVLAANLRRLRIARHLSLSELARGAGIGKATLSGIESARANPTVETLAGLAGALRTSVGELLEEPPLGDIRIVRTTHDVPAPRDAVPRRLLEEIPPGGSVEVAELVLAAGQRSEVSAHASGARAYVYVRAGKLLAGPDERHIELAPGDYASFPADVPQVYEATKSPARALLLTLLPD
jgi:transcriptional regulator with XRE-family HTH domain